MLFNLGDGRSAFREINGLMSHTDREAWIWPWCARLVASFGRTTVDNAVQARAFWLRYIQVYPDHSPARRELLMSAFYLRGQGHDLGQNYDEFRHEFDRHITHVAADEAVLPWDRLGHWAQDDGDWAEAERCFRKAYDLEGGHYGYCLGTALNFQDRFEESLPLLLEQAQKLQPDAMSWFQAGVAYSGPRQLAAAVGAYEWAVDLDPNYAIAMFDLGGAYWNQRERDKALKTW